MAMGADGVSGRAVLREWKPLPTLGGLRASLAEAALLCASSSPPLPACPPLLPLRPVQSPLPANSNDLLSERESQHSCIWKGKPGQGPDTPHWGPFPDWGTVYLD